MYHSSFIILVFKPFQSELYPGDPEPQIIEYKTQQNKLFPALAKIFAFHFTSQSLLDTYHFVQESIDELQHVSTKNEEQNNNDTLEKADFMLAELHMLSSGLKALITQEVASSINMMRQACGGHGYMSCSNLPRLFGLATAACTYEGENTVLLLQVSFNRYPKE